MLETALSSLCSCDDGQSVAVASASVAVASVAVVAVEISLVMRWGSLAILGEHEPQESDLGLGDTNGKCREESPAMSSCAKTLRLMTIEGAADFRTGEFQGKMERTVKS